MAKCAPCHNPFKDGTGPSLAGLLERGPWADRTQLYAWIRDPSGFMKNNKYTRDLKGKFGSVMTAFPAITDAEVDAVLAYLATEIDNRGF